MHKQLEFWKWFCGKLVTHLHLELHDLSHFSAFVTCVKDILFILERPAENVLNIKTLFLFMLFFVIQETRAIICSDNM